jgi:protein subunit release factor A
MSIKIVLNRLRIQTTTTKRLIHNCRARCFSASSSSSSSSSSILINDDRFIEAKKIVSITSKVVVRREKLKEQQQQQQQQQQSTAASTLLPDYEEYFDSKSFRELKKQLESKINECEELQSLANRTDIPDEISNDAQQELSQLLESLQVDKTLLENNIAFGEPNKANDDCFIEISAGK